MATERCPKCGTPKHEIEVTRDVLRPFTQDEWDEVTTYEMLCPLDPKDCLIKSLERQLEEARAEVDSAVSGFQSMLHERDAAQSLLRASEARERETQSKLDAALAQMGVLREKLELAIRQNEHDMLLTGDELRGMGTALSNTSATAQQRVEAIRREAVEALGAGLQAIIAERKRQMEAEGWTPEHDDEHAAGQLADAAACYALADENSPRDFLHAFWPWGESWWKPSTPRRNLEKAGALIAAEIDRLDRAAILGEKEG